MHTGIRLLGIPHSSGCPPAPGGSNRQHTTRGAPLLARNRPSAENEMERGWPG